VGRDFPPAGDITVSINGHPVTNTVTIDAEGNLLLLLDTTDTKPGHYTVTISMHDDQTSLEESSVSFELALDAPICEPEPDSSTPVFTMPKETHAHNQTIYLPLLHE
jgi:hypothetical protein